MLKQKRTEDYQKKIKQNRVNRQHQLKINTAKNDLKSKINKMNLKELLCFMENQYDQEIRKNRETEKFIKEYILRRVEQIKYKWAQFHKQRLINYIKKCNVYLPSSYDFNYDSVYKLLKKSGRLWIFFAQRKYLNYSYFLKLSINTYEGKHTPPERFFILSHDKSVNFHINTTDSKQMKVDMIEMCVNLIQITQDAESYVSIKDNY